MKAQDNEVCHLIHDEVVEAIRGTLEVVGAVVNAVSDVVTKAMATPARDALKDVVQGALAGAVSLIGDSRLAAEGVKINMGLTAKGIMVGVVRGKRQTGAEALDTISDVAGHIIAEVIASGREDVAIAAKSSVEGAIEGAQSIGLDVRQAASAAAAGALKSAYEMGPEAGIQVHQAVTREIAKF